MKCIRCCKDCSSRYSACHDTCERYKKEKEEYQEDKEMRYKEAHKREQYDEFRAEQVRKAYKHRRKK